MKNKPTREYPLMSENIGKCATCDNNRTGAHPQCDDCRNKTTIRKTTPERRISENASYPDYIALVGSRTYHKPAWQHNKYLHKDFLTTVCGSDSMNTVVDLFPNEQRYTFNKKPCKRCFRGES